MSLGSRRGDSSAREVGPTSTTPPKRWGPWSFKRSNLTLVHDDGYEVDVERCTNSAQTLDWIAQIANKKTHTVESVGHFVRAINDLLRLQETVCGSGVDHTIDVKKVLRRVCAEHCLTLQ